MKLCLLVTTNRVGFLCLLAGSLTLVGMPATFANVAARTSQAQTATSRSSLTSTTLISQLDETSAAQVTSVSQLSDVQPTDWAFQSVQFLVEHYGCIAGYPNGTFRGNRALTRYEFAAGLKACLDRVNELSTTGTSNLVRREDIATLQRLQQEFANELIALRGRVDNLEQKTSQLEANRFSTTTKLNGEALFALVGVAGGQDANGNKIAQVTSFNDRIRLNFDTSFTSKDLLRVRLQAINLNSLANTSTHTPEGDLRFSTANPTTPSVQVNGANNSVALDALFYAFPVGKNTTLVLEGNAAQPDDFTNTVNPYIDNDGASGALSNFGTYNPIYNLSTGAGIGLRHEFGSQLELSLGYLANLPAQPNGRNGLFGGAYGAIGQLTIKPSKILTLGLTYVNSYNTNFTAGSNRANLNETLNNLERFVPNFLHNNGLTAPNPQNHNKVSNVSLPVSSNSYGVEASYQVNPKFLINGWVGYTASRTLSAPGNLPQGDLSILNYAVALAFPDFGKKGSLAGIIFGMEPRVIDVSRSLKSQIGTDRDDSFHIEGFYQYRLSDNIFITPGIILITNPDFNNRNADDFIGAIRTTFFF